MEASLVLIPLLLLAFGVGVAACLALVYLLVQNRNLRVRVGDLEDAVRRLLDQRRGEQAADPDRASGIQQSPTGPPKGSLRR